MDYSAFYPSILINYFLAFAGVILIIVLLICGDVFLIREYLESKSVIEIVGVIACSITVIAVAYYSRNFFKDIPNIIGKNYIVATGTAHGWHTAGQEPESRVFEFKKDDGEIINIFVTYTPVYQGDRFEVIYLSNTEIGAIVRKIEGGELP